MFLTHVWSLLVGRCHRLQESLLFLPSRPVWGRTCPWWMTWMFGRSVRKTLNPEGGGGGGEGEERGGGGGGAISTEERVQRGPNNWPHQGQPPILSAIQRATPKSNTIGEISLACHSKSLIFFFKQHISPLPNHSENHNAPWSPFSFNNFCKRLPSHW